MRIPLPILLGAVLFIVILSPEEVIAGSNIAGDSVWLNAVSPSVVSGNGEFTVSGNVTAANGSVTEPCTNIQNYNPNCGLLVSVISPNNRGVANARPAIVGLGLRGTFSVAFVAGGSPDWVSGTYTVVASYITTYDNTIPNAVATQNFTYSASASTLSSSTQSSSSQSTPMQSSTVLSTSARVSSSQSSSSSLGMGPNSVLVLPATIAIAIAALAGWYITRGRASAKGHAESAPPQAGYALGRESARNCEQVDG